MNVKVGATIIYTRGSVISRWYSIVIVAWYSIVTAGILQSVCASFLRLTAFLRIHALAREWRLAKSQSIVFAYIIVSLGPFFFASYTRRVIQSRALRNIAAHCVSRSIRGKLPSNWWQRNTRRFIYRIRVHREHGVKSRHKVYNRRWQWSCSRSRDAVAEYLTPDFSRELSTTRRYFRDIIIYTVIESIIERKI